MNRAGLFIASTGLMLSACTTFGGTIRGDFSCRAPQGTCSPLSVNDSAALAILEQRTPPPIVAQARRVTDAATRTRERLLTVILPAHVDESGVLHDTAAVHIVAEPPRWGDPLPTSVAPTSVFSRSIAPSLREVIDGTLPPSVEGPGFSPGRVPQLSSVPSADAVEAARAGHRIARPSLPHLDLRETGTSTDQPPIRSLTRPPLAVPDPAPIGRDRSAQAEPRR